MSKSIFEPSTLTCQNTQIIEYFKLKILLWMDNYMKLMHTKNGNSDNSHYYIMPLTLNNDIFLLKDPVDELGEMLDISSHMYVIQKSRPVFSVIYKGGFTVPRSKDS